jgi:hypothetical protein
MPQTFIAKLWDKISSYDIKYQVSDFVKKILKSNILRFRFSITKAIEYRNSLPGQTDYQKSVGKLIIKIIFFDNIIN